MSRGLGRRERHVLDVCRAWAAAEPNPAWRWAPMEALVTPDGGRSEREALRRAVCRLAEQGLVERGGTGYWRALLRRRAGEEWYHSAAETPVVHRFGGDRSHQVVVRLPLSAEDRIVDEAERKKRDQLAMAAMAMLKAG